MCKGQDPDYLPIDALDSNGTAMIHGLFKGMLSGGTRPANISPKGSGLLAALHPTWASVNNKVNFTVIGAVEGPDTVIIKMSDYRITVVHES